MLKDLNKAVERSIEKYGKTYQLLEQYDRDPENTPTYPQIKEQLEKEWLARREEQ